MPNRLSKNGNFVLLWFAQLVSGIGDILYSAGIMVNVYQFTGSALQTAMVMVATTLPAFIIGPFAGAVVDRYDRKLVLLFMDIARAFLVTLLLFVITENGFNLVGMYAIVAALSVASAFYRPAKMAIIPSIVQKENLGQANSILIGTTQGIMAIGFGLGGLMTLWFGFEYFVYINAITFVISAFLTYFLETPLLKKQTGQKRESMLDSIRNGYHDLRDHKVAYPLVLMEIMEYFPHGIWTSAILLAFVEKALNGTADDWGYTVAAYFSGSFIGALLATFAQKTISKNTGWIIVINAFLTSLMTFAFGMSPTIFFAIIICLVFGIPNAIRDVAQDTLLQTAVDQKLLGRVYAFRGMFTNVMFMLGGIGFAWFADFADVRYIYITGAILYLLTGVYAFGNTALRESRIR